MDEEERISLIRRGNELFNKKDYKNALKIFLATNYKDGIIRVADYLYFDKGERISAIKLYKKAGHQKLIDDFAEKAACVIRMMMEEDKLQEKVIKEIREAFVEEKPIVIHEKDIKNINETENNKTKGEERK